jgi:hypothetical protein
MYSTGLHGTFQIQSFTLFDTFLYYPNNYNLTARNTEKLLWGPLLAIIMICFPWPRSRRRCCPTCPGPPVCGPATIKWTLLEK